MNGKATQIGKTVKPGETAEVSVALTAPSTTGTINGTWRLMNDKSQPFGTLLTVEIKVNASRLTKNSSSERRHSCNSHIHSQADPHTNRCQTHGDSNSDSNANDLQMLRLSNPALNNAEKSDLQTLRVSLIKPPNHNLAKCDNRSDVHAATLCLLLHQRAQTICNYIGFWLPSFRLFHGTHS